MHCWPVFDLSARDPDLFSSIRFCMLGHNLTAIRFLKMKGITHAVLTQEIITNASQFGGWFFFLFHLMKNSLDRFCISSFYFYTFDFLNWISDKFHPINLLVEHTLYSRNIICRHVREIWGSCYVPPPQRGFKSITICSGLDHRSNKLLLSSRWTLVCYLTLKIHTLFA